MTLDKEGISTEGGRCRKVRRKIKKAQWHKGQGDEAMEAYCYGVLTLLKMASYYLKVYCDKLKVQI